MSVFKPSYIEPLRCSYLAYSNHFDILRDDLIHPLVSGNKWRKLKYFLQAVLENGDGPIVTFGGAYSNHLVATAFAGEYFNIPTYGFVRGDEVRPPNLHERSCERHGMTLQHVSRTLYRNKRGLFSDYSNDHQAAVFLDEGGDHPLALKGCAEILDELHTAYDYIILACGTGTTMEGLVKGVGDRKLKTKVIGISVLKYNQDLNARLDKYPHDSWMAMHDYHRGKYAKTDDGLTNFIEDFKLETGILLDAVYTGKMMLAAVDLFRQGLFNENDKILLIHTGGVPDLQQ